MRLGLVLPHEGPVRFAEVLELAQRAERLGFDSLWAPESWGTDAISVLGALAARTERIRLGTAIINVFSRSPALIAQTAATLDAISGGRFILGLGTSGHQVIEGWHGVPFEQPVRRMRETVQVVRAVLRREPLRFEGSVFSLPQGLKLRTRPLRAEIPVFLATLTPAGLRLTGELADGWIPTLFSPEHIGLFRDELEKGARVSGRPPDSVVIAPFVPVAIDEDHARARDALRPWAALYVGGMGSINRNFYNDTVARYGFAREAWAIRELYLAGRKGEAAGRVPDRLLDAIAITGPKASIRDRLQVFSAAGIHLLLARLQAADHAGELQALEILARAV